MNEQIMKTKALLKTLFRNTDNFEQDRVNMHTFSTCLRMLQENINIIKALKAPPMDPENLKIPIYGTQKRLVLNIPKLHEALHFEDIPSEDEKTESPPQKPKPKLDFEIPPEDHKYLGQALKGHKFTPDPSSGLLEKSSMVQILKLIGDFAKTKNDAIFKFAQSTRLTHYGKDDMAYIDSIRQTLLKEEQNYDYCQKVILHKLRIDDAVFDHNQRALMSDPMMSIELNKSFAETETNDVEIPDGLTRDIAVEIVKKANDIAYEKYKDLHPEVSKISLHMTPVMITCLSHDYILDVYGYDEVTFKAVIQHFKVFEEPELAMYLYNKQQQLNQL